MTVVISQSIEFKMEILAKKKRENIKIIKKVNPSGRSKTYNN